MTDQDRVSSEMATLMPAIRKAFKQGVEKHALSAALRVELRESALNLRLPNPEWPGPGDALVEPAGTPVTALRLCRELKLPSVDVEPQSVEEDLAKFGEETAQVYAQAVLSRLVAQAVKHPNATAPDADALRARAKLLGPPCRVVAGPGLHAAVKDLSDVLVEDVKAASDWPDQRALLLPLTSKGPWVEELEPEFVIEWEPDAGRAVNLQVSRRLYLHNAGTGYLYEP